VKERDAMAKFATVPVQDVAPRRRPRQSSRRAEVRAQYREALEDAIDQHLALVVELENSDKPLTIRNRLARAAAALGYEDVVIRRRGTRIVAYRPHEEEAPKVATDDALGG
jgi:hypothetical protein